MKWRKIASSIYEISDAGKVRNSTNGKILRTKINHCGYECIVLKVGEKKCTCRIHRLIAQAFLPNPKNKPEVHHINGDKLDNRIENLTWSDPDSNKWWSRNVLGHSKMYSFKMLEALYKENPDRSLRQFINQLKNK